LNIARIGHFDLIPAGGILRGYTSSEEFQAGYEARLRDDDEYHTATRWWRTGGLMQIESLGQVQRGRIQSKTKLLE
jgi:hypothetical protein